MSNRAWVTLATNDSYGLGALVLAHSLRRAESVYPAVVLITPSVSEAMRERLRAVFVEVIIVDVLDSRDAAHLALLSRPELGITFTKIHCWGLTQFEKCVFLDADTLVVQNCDELFEREELSAAPDVGWPDCFNSGVFVYKPSKETFEALLRFSTQHGSFDGGDQGLLNSFFSDWAHGDISKHLPFLYNVTSAAFYSYLPALKHFGQNLKIIHFIGNAKPWLQPFNWETRNVDGPGHLLGTMQLWWDIFVLSVHPHLDTAMSGVAGNLARITPGSYGSQREAVDELTRRQGWEAGNIDYMGADSFDNIWAKISQTLAQTRTSPPKETTPPLKQQTPPPSLAKEPGPPTKQPSPQPKQPSPPTKQPTPPPKQSTPPPKQSTHPPKQRTPPPKQASPPPEQSTPPPKQPTPPPKQASSPPEQSTPTPKQPSPAKDTQSVQIVPAAQQEQPKEAPAVPQEQQKEGPADPIDTKKSTEPTQVQAVEPDVTKITAPISTASVATVSDIPVVIPEATVTALESGAPVESTVLPVDTVTSDIPLEPSPSESATKPETVADEPKIEEPSKDAKPDSISPVAPVAPVEKTEVESPQDIKPTEVSKTAKTESDTKVDETKSEAEALTQKPSEAAISEPKASVAAPVTPEKSLDLTISSTDSPPLANTPAKEEPQPLPAAAPKTTEEAAQETRL